MKKITLILIIALFTMSSCSRYVNTGGGGCGVWMPKKYTGAYKPQYTEWRYKTGAY
jgi:hypothetical protein